MDTNNETPQPVDRREALRRMAGALLGAATLAGLQGALAARAAGAAPTGAQGEHALEPDEVALLDEVAETILPETATPGAKAAGVGAFMALMLRDVLNPAQQRVFVDGMRELGQRSRARFGSDFRAAAPAQRLALLEELDREQAEHAKTHADDAPAHWFRMMKGLAVFGYFTSEIGATRALRYVEAPGRFDPLAAYSPGQHGWAKHGSEVAGMRVPGLSNDRRSCRPQRNSACS